MEIFTYDFEVFAYDWLIVLKNYDTGERTHIHNDSEALRNFMDSHEDVFVGFNTKHYDQFIMKAACCGATPQELKEINDFIIRDGQQGWDHPLVKESRFWFHNCDIMDDMQMGLSLKAIEGHLGRNIEETGVAFDIDRPLTQEEIDITFHYCDSDVDATEAVVKLRTDYLKNKMRIGELAGLDNAKALSMTNAKLTAAMLKATPQEHNDEREYKYPEKLKREYIPQEVFDFFDRMHDPNLSDEEVFKGGNLEITIGECPVTLGYGGIHAAIPTYRWEEPADGSRIIRNWDVSSYYPHLMTLMGYTSRNIPSPGIFKGVLETRMKAKAEGNKALNLALKLVVNTTYGAMLNQYNDLYDPLMGRSVCITGQLFLLELAEHCYKDIPGLKIVQLNTDGMMVEFDKEFYPQVLDITQEWQDRTGFELEEDKIAKIAQKDVNNYVEVLEGGKAKAKGGYLVRGIAPAGAFNINNNACIIATALKEYFVHGTPVEKTIRECDDIFQFQLIAKAGSKYSRAYQIVDGEEVATQKVNRVYASTDTRLGKLYKVKAETGAVAKIESLPDHCIIDNSNKLTIDSVGKEWYIKQAQKKVNDFLGIKPEKKGKTKMDEMQNATPETEEKVTPPETEEKPKTHRTRKPKAETTEAPKVKAAVPTVEVKPMNVYGKLQKARQMFLDSHVQKSGKNMHLEFEYFELADIVPPAIRIFSEVGLISLPNFKGDVATLDIVNIDDPEQVIVFTAPFDKIQPIVSNAGKQATNSMQALGSSITYMRRYLYMMALDITEPDEFDANVGAPIKVDTPPVGGSVPTTHTSAPVGTGGIKMAGQAPKTPVSAEKREAIAGVLADADGPATDLQIGQLKKALSGYLKKFPDAEKQVTDIALKTKGFTEITKSQCENIAKGIAMKMNGGEQA